MLNKNILRQYADPGLTIPANHGLLHAEQISYIIRTAVRIIDHHRTLILYIYNQEEILQDITRPLWTMFQTKSDFITLAHSDSGKWRAARFARLSNDYNFTDKCAFYSESDEITVQKYFHSKYSGFYPLICAQSDILAAQLRKYQRQRDRIILARMKPVRALPRGLESWVRRSVMPAYFFYDYNQRKAASGTCSACGNLYAYCYVKVHLDRHLEKAAQGIRFITPNYSDLFRIPDGDKIRITTSDGKVLDRTCRYIDETHIEIDYSSIHQLLHICQFAELTQHAGSKVIPLRSSLPEKCFAADPDTGETVVITKGEAGWTPTGQRPPEGVTVQEGADLLNAEMGVTKAQAAAMLVGATQGWASPDADPAYYDTQGNPHASS